MGKSLHKGWFILAITVLNLLACLGLGRFSLGAIIPFMKEGLDLNYSQMGIIASSIFLGYLCSATLVGHVVAKYTAKKVIIVSLFVTAIGMIGSGLATNFWTAYVSCLVVGIGAGGGNVTNLGLIGQWFAPRYRGMALGITNSGSGLGMVFSGFFVPMMIGYAPENGWRYSWYALAIAVLAIFIINIFFLRNTPSEIGLHPVGHIDNGTVGKRLDGIQKTSNVYRNKKLWIIGLIYMSWGFSYLVFSTFLVDYLIKDVKLDEETAGWYFSVAGVASILSGFIWGSVSDRLGRFAALFFIYISEAVLLLALSLSNHSGLLLFETVLYAITLWGVPTVMVAAVGDLVTPQKIPVAIGFITLFFGVGQLISPVVTGSLLDHTGSYMSVFVVSAMACFIGGLGCIGINYSQRKQHRAAELTLIEKQLER